MLFPYFAGMKTGFIFICTVLSAMFFSCADAEKNQPAENDIAAARKFIRSTLDGDYPKARQFVLNDSLNMQYFDAMERNYNDKMRPDQKEEYRNASIIVHDITSLNDSVSVISYSNSYFRKDTNRLKVVRINNEWLVDFKYYFQLEKDSLP
jgi:hypothetical protein